MCMYVIVMSVRSTDSESAFDDKSVSDCQTLKSAWRKRTSLYCATEGTGSGSQSDADEVRCLLSSCVYFAFIELSSYVTLISYVMFIIMFLMWFLAVMNILDLELFYSIAFFSVDYCHHQIHQNLTGLMCRLNLFPNLESK